jgi:hypothetical protein
MGPSKNGNVYCSMFYILALLESGVLPIKYRHFLLDMMIHNL